ncbi:MAG: lipid-A-disaccharide synthase [Candidatus Omnitrophota bacterium]
MEIMLVCGEPSGDLHASNLACALKELRPDIKISGVGGNFCSKAGVEIIHDIKDLSVLGLFDVLKKLPKFFALKKLILRKIKEKNPACLILVDFSGFNLRLAKALNNSLPIFYYISPQVWASRPGRIQTIKKYIKKILVVFKFEEELYRKNNVDVEFVGHPLLDIVKPTLNKEEFCRQFNLDTGKLIISLLPGSRKSEIKNILPVMLKSICLIKKQIPQAQFIISKVPSLEKNLFDNLVKNIGFEVKIIEALPYDCLNVADFVLVCSGTATLETAILEKPALIIYKMSLLNYLLYRPQIKIPYIGLANIVAGKLIYPEFIQFKTNPKTIAKSALEIINSPKKTAEIKKDLNQIKYSLGEPNASIRAAKIILENK